MKEKHSISPFEQELTKLGKIYNVTFEYENNTLFLEGTKYINALDALLSSDTCPSGLCITFLKDQNEAANLILKVLKNGYKFEQLSLDFQGCRLGTKGAKVIGKILEEKSASCIHSLDLSLDNFAEGIEFIAQSLTKGNTSAELALNFRLTHVDDKGAKLIGEALAKNIPIKTINLLCNRYSEQGINDLLRGVFYNFYLKQLELSTIKCTPKQKDVLTKLLKRNEEQMQFEQRLLSKVSFFNFKSNLEPEDINFIYKMN